MKILKATLLLFFIFLFSSSFAQIDSISKKSFRNWVDSSIQYLNFFDVNSGILFEKGAMSENHHYFQGLSTDSFGTISDLMGHYNQIYYSRVNGAFDSLTHPDSLYYDWRKMSTGRIAAISLIYSRFDTLARQGVNDTPFFREYDSILYDNPNRVGSPYVEDTLFICASQQETFVHGKIAIQFPSSHLFALGIDSFILEADFGNGCGWRTIKPDSIYNLLYQDSGQYIILIRITPEDSRAFLAKTIIEILHGDWIIPSYDPVLTALPEIWNDEMKAGVEAYIYPANIEANCLGKPFIFVEGFDPLDERNKDHLKRLLQEKAPGDLNNFYEQLVSRDYDIIILNFANGHGGDLIQENAAVLERLINWVNLHKCGTEKLVVSGASMGGLISRYCLAKMEHECKDHQTRLYISMDAGHHGVNVPLGLQYMTQDARNHSPKFFKTIHDSYDMLTANAGRQMMVSSFENGSGPHSLYTSFMAELNSYGLPQQCRNIAFSLGNTFIQDAYYTLTDYKDKQVLWVNQVAPNEKILEWKLDVFKDEVDVWVKTVGQNSAHDICYSRYSKREWFGGSMKLKKDWHYNYATIPANHDTRRGSVVTTQYDIYRAINIGCVNVNEKSYHTIIHVNSGLYIVDEHKDNDNLNEYSPDLISESKTDFDNVAVTNHDYVYRHVMITEALRDFMLNEIDAVSGIPITRHLNVSLPYTFPQVSSTPFSSYNFGESLRGQHLSTIDINSGGTVYINKSGATEYGNGPNNKTNHFNLESQPCSYINVHNGGTFEIGSATTSAVVRIKNGSLFDIRSGGVLRIHNGSTLVIEDGATFVFNPGAVIYLQGNNAVLEIRGGLTIKNNAVFSFSAVSSPAGFIRFVKDGAAGTKLITAEGTNASISIIGSACGDKILEIENCNLTPEYSSISPSHYFSSITIKNGHIKYSGSGAALSSGSPGELSGLHLEHYAGATNTKGLVTKGQASCTLTNIKFNGLTTGLYADNSVYGNDLSLDNCRFYGGNTGIFVPSEGVHASNCYFESQNFAGIDAVIENNSSLTDCDFFGGNATTDQGLYLDGSSTASMSLNNCHFSDYQYGVQVSGSTTTLISECSYFQGNEVGILGQSGSSIDLSGASGYSGGTSTFYFNDVAIEGNQSRLYLKSGSNRFIGSSSTPAFLVAVLNASQSQYNNSPNPGLLDIDGNYWSPAIPGSIDANFAYLRVPDGGTYKNVWLSGSAISDPGLCYSGTAPSNTCTVSAKTSSTAKNPMTAKEISTDDKNSLVSVFPNPANSELIILSDKTVLKQIRLYDMTGKLVLSENYENRVSAKLLVGNLPNGLYYMQVESNSETIHLKISIQH